LKRDGLFSYRYFVDSGNIVSSLFFSRLVGLEYFKPEKTAVDFSLCIKVPSQQSSGKFFSADPCKDRAEFGYARLE
jgi:hypothetical protein